MTEIPPGDYALVFTTGIDWIESGATFCQNPAYREFEKTLQYVERQDEDGLEYHTIRVSLQPVPGGNVRTKTITREEFLKGAFHSSIRGESVPTDATYSPLALKIAAA